MQGDTEREGGGALVARTGVLSEGLNVNSYKMGRILLTATRFLAAIAALYALMLVGLSVSPSLTQVARSVPKLLNDKNGIGNFLGVLHSKNEAL